MTPRNDDDDENVDHVYCHILAFNELMVKVSEAKWKIGFIIS